MAYCEKIFQSEFSKKNKENGVFELKLVKNKRFALSQMRKHQVVALINASNGKGCAHKISDASYEQKPFDCFRIAHYPAYVVIMFWESRKNKMVYYVKIARLLKAFTVLEKKSMTEDEILEIASIKKNYYGSK